MGWSKGTKGLLIAAIAAALLFWAGDLYARERPSPADKKPYRAKSEQAQQPAAENHIPKGPAIPLTEYQRNWVQDKSRFKIGVFTRQGGKSFGTSLEAVDDCMERRTKWVFLSAGERQSKELMATAAMHARAYGLAIRELEGEFVAQDKTVYKQLEIVFPNGSRIVGLPANPNTARGHSAHILLDEFAFHGDSRAIWKALFPTVTRGYKIRIISTFKGRSNKFYELFFSAPTLQRFNGPEHERVGERGGWSKHFVDIYQAVEMGLELKDDEGRPCEPEDLRLALNDDEAWAEEYECVPSEEADSFLPHDLISSVEDVKIDHHPAWVADLIARAEENHRAYEREKADSLLAEACLPLDLLTEIQAEGEFYLGYDVGRRRDLSVLWLDEKADVFRSRAVIDLRRQPFYVQKQVLFTVLAHPKLRRGCIDQTGLGLQLAEEAQTKYGAHKVEAIDFTAANKEAMATGLKRNFEDKASRIPADSQIRRSLHSVKKYATTTKHFRFDAERTDETGHADHFWAKALAVQAGSGPASVIEFQSTGVKREFTRMKNFMGA